MKVIITGAAGGTATTAALRRQGATVVGLDLTGADIDCDVRDQAAVDRAVAAAIERLGGLDVLINNAGLGTPQSAAAAPDADALDVLAVNLVGPWRVTATALPALRASRGRVEDAARALTRGALGPPVRDLATTRRGEAGYRLARLAPRGLLDRITTRRIRKLAQRGHFAAGGLAGEYAARLRD